MDEKVDKKFSKAKSEFATKIEAYSKNPTKFINK